MTTVIFSTGFWRGTRFRKSESIISSSIVMQSNSFSYQRLPTDSIGTMTLNFDNVIDNSAIQVETQDGTVVHNGVSPTNTYSISIDVYSSGSPLNNLVVKIRKGSSAPYYRPWDTLVTATLGSQSIYVSQIPD